MKEVVLGKVAHVLSQHYLRNHPVKSFYYDERYYSYIRTEATKIQDPPDLVVSVPQIPQVGIFAQA